MTGLRKVVTLLKKEALVGVVQEEIGKGVAQAVEDAVAGIEAAIEEDITEIRQAKITSENAAETAVTKAEEAVNAKTLAIDAKNSAINASTIASNKANEVSQNTLLVEGYKDSAEQAKIAAEAAIQTVTQLAQSALNDISTERTDTIEEINLLTQVSTNALNILSSESVTAIETLRDSTIITINNLLAETVAARDVTLEARDETVEAKNVVDILKETVETKTLEAINAASNAATSETNTKDSETASKESELKAKDWACKEEDSEVDEGLFSSKHYAAKTEEAKNIATNAANAAGVSEINALNSATTSLNARNDAQNYRDQASTFSSSASQSATTAEAAKNNAATSATNALNEANKAKDFADASEANADTAISEASKSEAAALTSVSAANTATQSEANALQYKNDANSSADAAATNAGLAENFKNTTADYKDLTEGFKNTTENLLDATIIEANKATTEANRAETEANRAAGFADSMAGGMAFLGLWDASDGVLPPIPEVGSAQWKISVGGVLEGNTVNEGDTLIYSNLDGRYLYLDTKDQVSSVNGRIGAVSGLAEANDIAPVGYTGNYNDLVNKPSLSINNWNTAFSWGNHATAGYTTGDNFSATGNYPQLRAQATTKADVGLSGIPDTNGQTTNWLRGDGNWEALPASATRSEISLANLNNDTNASLGFISGRRLQAALVAYTDRFSEAGYNKINWDAAYSWGDHREEGYLTSVSWALVSSKPATATRWPTWAEVTNKPSSFTPSTHTHSFAELPISQAEVTNWNTAYSWGNHAAEGYLKAVSWNDVSSKPATATRWPAWSEVTGKPALAPASHSHGYADLPFAASDVTNWNTAFSERGSQIAGTGLSWTSGNLNVQYGTTAGTSAQGNDPRLSDSREWTATTVSQSEAQAGTATTRRAWTSQRVRQNVAAYTDSFSASSYNNSNWDTAFGWGNHASAGYAVSGTGTSQVRTNSQLDSRYVLQSGYNAFNPSGTYSGLRAQATTKADVGLGNVPNIDFREWGSSPVGHTLVHDARVIQGSTGASDYLPTPENIPDKAVTVFFTTAPAGSSYRGAVAVKSWSGQYSSWLLSGPGGTTDNNDERWFLRSGAGGVWGNDLEIWHSGNSDPFNASGNYASLRARGTTKADVGLSNIPNWSGSTSTSLGTSNTVIPSQGAVKSYVDTGLSGKANTTGTYSIRATGTTKADVGLSGIPNTNGNTSQWLRGDGSWVAPPNTNTTYSAGAGLTLSGTQFSLPVSVSGSGTYVSSVAQTATGLQVTLGTPPNTTYSVISTAEIDAGTASTARTISAQRIKHITDKLAPVSHSHGYADLPFSSTNVSNWNTAFTERGSQIAGTGLSWTSGNLNVSNPFNPSGSYSGLRAQATTKADVGLSNVRNLDVHDFGLGREDGGPIVSDFHTTKELGFYRWSSGSQNSPTSTGGGAIRLARSVGSSCWIASVVGGGEGSNRPELYTKSTSAVDDDWSHWHRISVLDTNGTFQNGWTYDTADGRESYYLLDHTISNPTWVASGDLSEFFSDVIDIPFPLTFSSSPVVSATVITTNSTETVSNNIWCVVVARANTASARSGARIRLFSKGGTPTSVTISLEARARGSR